jgi:CBS domain-containing protein
MADNRNQSDGTEFQDPLENYDPPTFADPLEKALHEQTVAAIQTQPYAGISPDVTVAEAIRRLSADNVACLLIEEDGQLIGVFSDRDVLNKVALEYDKLNGQPVSRVMNTDPVFVYDTDSSAAALSVMAVSGFRHVPVLNLDKELVGIVSPQRVCRFLREHSED